MGLLGVITLLGLGLFFVLMGVRMAPVYLENFSVGEVLDAVAQDPASRRMSPRQLREGIMRRLGINGVYDFPSERIRFRQTRHGLHVSVDYEVRKPVVGNVSVVMSFSDSADIPRDD